MKAVPALAAGQRRAGSHPVDCLPGHAFAERVNGRVEHASESMLGRQWHEGAPPKATDTGMRISCG